MDIRTKFEIGSIVYAVHPCKMVSDGKIVLQIGMSGVGTGQGHPLSEDIYIVSPHEVRDITASCNKGTNAEIIYGLSNGIRRTEKELFRSFEDATGYAVALYERSIGKYERPGGHIRTGILKEIVCKKLQHALKAVLSYEQLERFGEEFAKVTEGLVFKEA